jgi:hypothetical protein
MRDVHATAEPSRNSEELWVTGTSAAQRIYEELAAARRGSLTRAPPPEQSQGTGGWNVPAFVSGKCDGANARRPSPVFQNQSAELVSSDDESVEFERYEPHGGTSGNFQADYLTGHGRAWQRDVHWCSPHGY